ncbi:MAG: preprotein translocase subunit YajC [Eubacteriales bacterium]|jgi:preprotein translocase subunit YajC
MIFENILALTLAEAAAAPGMTGYGSWTTLIMLAIVAAVFYFFLYRPQKKQEAETNKMRNSLEVGDEVTTVGGIIGAVVSIKGETVTIETSADRTKIRVLRDSIRSIDVPINPKKEEPKTPAKLKKAEKAEKVEDGKKSDDAKK